MLLVWLMLLELSGKITYRGKEKIWGEIVMGDHVVLYVDRLVMPTALESVEGAEGRETQSGVLRRLNECEGVDEEEPLIQVLECRICQEEDEVENLENPCGCSGSLKYAHRDCVQKWCNEKRGTICEICNQPYQPNYTALPPLSPCSGDTTINIGEGWMISETPFDMHDPRILAVTTEHHFLDADFDEYGSSNTSGAAFCRSAALILLALLLLRHTLAITSSSDEDVSTFFSIFLLRAAGFLLPCYIMAWAISVLQQRRQRDEVAALAAASEVTFVLQSGQQRVTVLPGSALAAAANQESESARQ
ncbi:hypothetical protein GIB67_012050 [Kingdonia uniflora]|uniref:RING-CH-type domain-containing protein n=1 Tax=Kingdonia uniflora TaxID=39325 RepID=A0A7J7M083_9MAGN|nr:hypothetical protein GIB67_012050 [Kingdonia uniflora]